MQLAKKLRETSEIPIIIVSGRKDEADRVMALELGADDYLTKPFGPRELLARVRAVLRRYQTAREVLPARNEKRRAYRFAGWELNLRTRRLTGVDGKRVELTNGEFSLLEAFCAAPQRRSDVMLECNHQKQSGALRAGPRRVSSSSRRTSSCASSSWSG